MWEGGKSNRIGEELGKEGGKSSRIGEELGKEGGYSDLYLPQLKADEDPGSSSSL